jgi:hypothetical protein
MTKGLSELGVERLEVEEASLEWCFAFVVYGPVLGVEHTSACISIRQPGIRQPLYIYNMICQHTSAYVSIRQHTSAYVSVRQHTSAYVCIRQQSGLSCAPVLGVPLHPKLSLTVFV